MFNTFMFKTVFPFIWHSDHCEFKACLLDLGLHGLGSKFKYTFYTIHT